MKQLRAVIIVFALIAVTGLTAAQTSPQDYSQWRGQNRDGSAVGIHRTENLARTADAVVEGRSRRRLCHADRRRQPCLHAHAPGRERSDAGARRRHWQGGVADAVSRAVQDEPGDQEPRTGPEVHAALLQRPPLYARHQRHRVGVPGIRRQAALAEAGTAGGSAATAPRCRRSPTTGSSSSMSAAMVRARSPPSTRSRAT